ncbi:MAG: hypothetical protein JNK87_07805 [Bryobacterales bacterium]|nr:hypothetical protein [Bryobacterales bacterium]
MQRRDLFRGVAGSAALAASGATKRVAPAKLLDRHRNLFTGDSCVYFYNPERFHPEGLPYTAKVVHRYVDLLADSGVDTFLSNPNASVVWYPSKRFETILDGYKRGDREFARAHARAARVPAEQMDQYLDDMVKFHNQYLDLVEAGVDWLAETMKACRRRKVAPWVSVRMNDTHGVEDPSSHFNCKLFRDPANRLSGRAPDPNNGVNAHWVALNYARQPVREFMMAQIHEYLEDYGFEGLELDWLRDPHILEPGASEADCAMITAWIREVRAYVDARSRATGKQIPLGMRIPVNLGYLRSRGLDVRAIAREGLVDFLGFSNFWQTTWDVDYAALRQEVGPNVVIYGVVEDAPNWIPGNAPGLALQTPAAGRAPFPTSGTRYLSGSAQMLRANAAGKLAMGVHGIEQFNFFCTDQPKVPGLVADYAALRGIHDLQGLRGQSKHYCLQTPTTWLSKLWETPEQLPAVIDPTNRREFRFSMCDEPRGGKLTIQVVVEKTPEPPRLGMSFNGAWPVFESKRTRAMVFPVGPYTEFTDAHEAWEFTLDTSEIRKGFNTVTVTNGTRGKAFPVKVVSVELGVRFA